MTTLVSSASDYTSALCMQTGSQYALFKGERVVIDEDDPELTPYHNGVTFYLPLGIIAEYAGYTYVKNGSTATLTSGGKTITLTVGDTAYSGGTLPIAPEDYRGEMMVSIYTARDIFGLKTYADDMGLVILSNTDYTPSYNVYSSPVEPLRILTSFIFDNPTGDEVIADIAENLGGEDVHPRLLATEDDFDELRRIYNTPDEELSESELQRKTWVQYQLVNAYNVLSRHYTLEGDDYIPNDTAFRSKYYVYDDNGKPLVGVADTENGIYGDGYDVGGRSDVSSYTGNLKNLAFAWQITRERKYADACYLGALEMGKWIHWGPGHFLNCADGAAEYAIAFDLVYDAFDGTEDQKNTEMAQILFEKAVIPGYVSEGKDRDSTYFNDIYSKRVGSGGWNWKNKTNNWMTVCASGMMMSCLAIAEYDDLTYQYSREGYTSSKIYNSGNCIRTLISDTTPAIHKALGVYIPDGCYIESPGYWAYGTNTYFLMCECFESACGTDYGFMSAPGLDKTCYFIWYIGDSDYRVWNYHDGGTGAVDLSHFSYVAQHFGDPNIAYFRKLQLDGGKSATLYDIFFYDAALASQGSECDLDYYFEGIDSVTMRSSWEPDSLFAGLHGGYQRAPHADYDTGNFILRNGGIDWFIDMGSEDYNLPNYWGWNTRRTYYKKSAESHSVVIVRNNAILPYGQVETTTKSAGCPVSTFVTEENGSLAVLDMKNAYGSLVSSAQRALLLTNSRRTVVVQDEYNFKNPTDIVWIGAINTGISAEIAADGRTAYLTAVDSSNNRITLRMTLLSDNNSLKFTYQNDRIFSTTNITTNGASKPVRRIVVNANGVTDLDMAVVFDFIKSKNEVVGYEKTSIAQMKITSSEWLDEANEGLEPVGPEVSESDFRIAVRAAQTAVSLRERFDAISKALELYMGVDQSTAGNIQQFSLLRDEMNKYDEQTEAINKDMFGLLTAARLPSEIYKDE